MLSKLFTILFIIYGIYIVAAADPVFEEKEECPQVCAVNFNPLCATNGKVYKEFSNSCELQASNCRLERLALQKYVPTVKDWCNTVLIDGLEQLLEKLDGLALNIPGCMQPCPLIYSPVCVSNGQYRAVVSNECLMEAINCVLRQKSKPLFSVLKYNSC